MALMQKLALKQGQSLVMTPQLQQAIKLLAMSNVELAEFVDQELERNPLLERSDAAQESTAKGEVVADVPDAPFSAADARGDEGDGALSPSDGPQENVTQLAAGPGLDAGWQNMRGSGAVSLDGEAQDYAASISREETLPEHLTSQLNLNFRDPKDLLIGQQAIGMVNEQGYLTASAAAIAQTLGTDVAHVERVLSVLKTFDPTGVFAADLKECLTLQLKERNRFDPAMEKLIDNLPLVARRDFTALKTLCGVSLDDLHVAMHFDSAPPSSRPPSSAPPSAVAHESWRVQTATQSASTPSKPCSRRWHSWPWPMGWRSRRPKNCSSGPMSMPPAACSPAHRGSATSAASAPPPA